MGESCLASTTGIRSESASTACYLSVSCLAEADGQTQTGFGFSVGRELDDLVSDDARDDAVRRATRLLGATKPSSTRATIVLDPYVTAMVIGIIGSTLSGESVLKGRSPFADRLGEEVASSLRHPGRRPHQPPRLHGAGHRRRGPGQPAQRPHHRRRAGLLRAQRLHRPLGRDGLHRQRRAGRVQVHPRGRLPGPVARAGHPRPARPAAPGGRRGAHLVGDRACTRASTRSAATSPPAPRASASSDGELGAPLREFTIASTLQRMLRDVAAVGSDVDWLPMSAAGVSLVIRGRHHLGHLRVPGLAPAGPLPPPPAVLATIPTRVRVGIVARTSARGCW